MTPEALQALHRYAWPGNVRELRNAIERAVVVAEGPRVALGDLPARVQAAARPMDEPLPPDLPAADRVPDAVDDELDASASRRPEPPLPQPAGGGLDDEETAAPDAGSYREQMQAFEAKLLRRALAESGWNRAEAAARMGMPLRTFAHKARLYGLRRPADS